MILEEHRFVTCEQVDKLTTTARGVNGFGSTDRPAVPQTDAPTARRAGHSAREQGGGTKRNAKKYKNRPAAACSSDSDCDVPDYEVDSDDEAFGNAGPSACDEGVAMPVMVDVVQVHREKNISPNGYSACVAESISKKVAETNKAAADALKKEWDKLFDLGTWRMKEVREWAHVAQEARDKDMTIHIGRVFDILVVKNSELPENHPLRKYKGRVVFEGCYVRDQTGNAAIFADLSSAPATMQVGKIADFYGSLLGHDCQQADAKSAYTQAKLGGTPTWVRLPKNKWPPEWFDARGTPLYDDPVVPLDLALYGHPDAGGYWERHCSEKLKKALGRI